jgi:hypothetical protein
MKTLRRILIPAIATLVLGGALAPHAQAAVTAEIGGGEAGGPANGGMSWDISYDDTTRDVTATAAGTGWCDVHVQLTNTISRIVVFVPLAGGTSQNPDIAADQPIADFAVPADGQPHVIASGINPNQVKRILGKATATTGGLNSTSEWSRI